MKKILILIIVSYSAFALNNIEFYLENDIFFGDSYYTNGVAWKYSFIKEEELWKDNEKSVWKNLIFGQKIYTPSNIKIAAEEFETYDRPYAGWLYFGYEEERAFRDMSKLKYGVVIGVTGEEALAEEAQNEVHEIIGATLAKGWSTQITNIIGVQINLDYQFQNFKKEIKTDIELTGDFKVKYEMGNVFFNFTISEEFKFGKILDFPYIDDFESYSYYFFLEPKLMLDIYDATIEGALGEDDSIYTKDIYHLIGKIEAGFKYRMKNLTLAYSVNMNSTDTRGTDWDLVEHTYHRFHIDFYF